MPEIDRLTEHQRTSPRDNGDFVLAAEADSRRRDAARPERAMHPHPGDSQCNALTHDLLARVRMGRNHNAGNTSGDGLQVRVTRVALDLLSIGVDGEDLILRAAQLAVH